MSDLWIIYCVVFAAVILAVQALYWLIADAQRRGATLKRRLALSAGRAASEPVDILRQERGLANLDHPRFASLNEFLAQTGVRISLLALCLWTASLGAMVALALFPFLSLWATAAAGSAVGPLVVVVYLSIVRRRRIDRFTAQLPDALSIIVRSLRIGHPFVSAIGLASREMRDPIAAELAITAEEIGFGQDITTAVAKADSSGRRNTLTGVAMNIRKRRSDRSGRVRLFSPGRPPVAGREERRRFWEAIAAGTASEDAAVGVGVPQAVGTRWFRKAGGMPPSMFGLSAKPLSGRYLSFAEREEIALLRVQGYSMQAVARRLGRVASTISRELRRNAATRSGGLEYRATTAQWHAERAARRPKQAKLARNARLRTYVEERLAGVVVAPSGAPVPGPVVSWKSRRHGPRKDRRWANAWSPEQIARRLPVDFADDATMRISHEAIYQALFVQGRGALRRELTACLRTGRVLRMPRARTRGRGKTFISPEIMISQRPEEAADRAVPGHWEGDLILGLGSSAIGTLVERTTRFTLLLHLPRMAGHGLEARVKNGPALAGHGAEAVRDAITRTIVTLPEQLRRSLTWDQGAEMAQHARLKIEAGVRVYFCDPHSPWQRGTNENTNGLLRQYFPKGTDLSMHSANEIAAVAAALNSRPRKTLDWKTPAEALDRFLLSADKDRVATTA